MSRKYLVFMFVFVSVFSFQFSSASVSILSPANNVEVIQNESLIFRANVVCDKDACNNFSVGLVIPNLESVNYNFSSSSSGDCFDGVCLAKPVGNGPLIFSSGDGSWGCGECFSGPNFIGANMKDLAAVSGGCVAGMREIVGVNLCFRTSNNNLWNVVFSSWPVGGSGDFVYSRTKEGGLIGTSQDSLSFFINSSGNPLFLNLVKDQSQEVSFYVVAKGTIGETYGLKIFFGDQLSEVVNVRINGSAVVPINNIGDVESTSGTKKHRSSDGNSNTNIFISDTSTGVSNNQSGGEDVLALSNLPVVDGVSKGEGYIVLWIVVLAIVICLLVLLVIKLRR